MNIRVETFSAKLLTSYIHVYFKKFQERTVSLLVYIYLCNVTCPAANISGASLRNTPPSGSNLSRSLNQIRELSSYKTTNSSLHALPNKRSNGKKEIHYVI